MDMIKFFSEDKKNSAVFYCDKDEFAGVKKISAKVCNDIKLVTGSMPRLSEVEASGLDFEKEAASVQAVVFGTVGKSKLIESFADKIDLSKIKGKREVYGFSVSDNLLVIAGSDKRGTIYGLFHLSELLGVSPFVDWLHLLPSHQDSVTLTEKDSCISKEPSVRFRGFFINDEWPAFGNWCNHNYGGFTAKMYEHVFELLLRLKGNYLWPAMWSSRFSDDGPGLSNAELADELGVVMGASHHEPCCRAGEEYKYLRGPDSIYGDAWNFRSNEKGITKFWEDGLKRNGKFENVITVGMRGEADTAIMKNATLADNIELLRDVLKTQNKLIKKYVNEDLQKVPRMLALYKEVEPYFYGDEKTKGLMGSPELDGVTLMLCDDNHGNLRTVPTEEMRSHNGGYGMYYHFDYHGWPFSYEWINTSYLPKVKEQMTAAYDFGIRDLWIVNVGDILTTEFPLSYFLDLAYDYEKYSALDFTTFDYTKKWIAFNFSQMTGSQKADAEFILNAYTKLANTRRTESIQSDTFHPVNFGESDNTLSLAEKIIECAENLKKQIPEDSGIYEAFFTQIYYAATGTMNVLRMQLLSGKNHWLASHNILAANDYAEKVKACVEKDSALVEELDNLNGGRWYGMGWSEHFGFKNWCEAENHYPVYAAVEPTRKKRVAAWVEGCDFVTSGQDWTVRDLHINDFCNPETDEAKVNVFNCGINPVQFSVEDSKGRNSWLSTQIVPVDSNKKDGDFFLLIKIDRNRLAADADKTDTIKLCGDDGKGAGMVLNIHVNADVPDIGYEKNTFVQTGSYISIEAPHYTVSKAADGAEWKVLEGYGKTLGAVKSFPVTKVYSPSDVSSSPFVEYKFVLPDANDEENLKAFDFYLNPSNPAFKDNRLQFIIGLNGEFILKDVVGKNFAVGDNQEPWGSDITNNIRVSTVYAACRTGMNTLRVYPVTPNIVLEKIVIHDANEKMPPSYLGAPETFYVK